MWRSCRAALPLLLLFVGILAGCGGGGSGTLPVQGSGRVRGTVDTASLNSDASANLSVDGKDITAPVAPDGSFILDNVPSGLHTLVIKANRQAGAMVVMVSDGKETNVGQMALRGSGQVAGLVTASPSGSPIPEALVTVTEMAVSISNDTPHPVRESHTNTNGSYTVDAVPEGDYLITISKDGYVPVTLNLFVSTGFTATGDVALLEADPDAGSMQGVVSGTNLDKSLSTLGGVFVVLTPNDPGTPPPDMPMPAYAMGANDKKISLYSAPMMWQQYYTYTADDGSYKIDGIPAGNYNAMAMRPGFDTASQSVTIAARQSVKVDFTLSMFVVQTGIVTGTVTNSDTGKPLAGVSVIAMTYGPCLDAGKGVRKASAVAMPGGDYGMNVSATTDENGNYKLQVPTAAFAINFFADGYDAQEKPVNVIQDQTVTLDVAMTPTPVNPNIDVTIKGIVREPGTDANAALVPSEGAIVHLLPNGVGMGAIRPMDYAAKTDVNGAYSLTVPSGGYFAYAEKDQLSSGYSNLRLYKDTENNFELSSSIPSVMPLPRASRHK